MARMATNREATTRASSSAKFSTVVSRPCPPGSFFAIAELTSAILSPLAGAGMTYAATATYDSAVATATASAWNATVAPAAGNGTALIAGPNQVVVAPMKGDLRMVPFSALRTSTATTRWHC